MNKLILYDINKDLCDCWNKYFKDIKNVTVLNCSFDDLESEYVVTAGNSYGWMTGGIDLVVRNYYGQYIQDYVQYAILTLPNRYLPVGENILVTTKDSKKPNLIYAPTMDLPKTIDYIDVFYVFCKLLQQYDDFACCGLGTGVGNVSSEQCAKAMYDAYTYINNK